MKASYSEECICRLCGRKDHWENLKNIFDNRTNSKLELKISKLLHIVVLPCDPLPHDVCNTCVDKLNLFNEFYDDVIKTDQFLRKFFPAAPRHEIESFNAIVSINDCIRSLSSYLKLPECDYQKTSNTENLENLENFQNFESPIPTTEENNAQVEVVNIVNVKPPCSEQSPKSLDGFIVNHITSSDSIFTCRECYRTFTRQTSALSHVCMTIENCGDFELTEISEEESPREKPLPPLKIRLFENNSGKYICYVCQTSFNDRMEIVDHLKSDCLKGGDNLECKAKKRRRSGSKKNILDVGAKKSCEIQNAADLNELGPIEELNQIDFTPDVMEMNSTENLNAYTSDSNIFIQNVKTVNEMNENTSKAISDCVVQLNELEDSKVKEPSRRKSQNRENKTCLFACVFCDKIYMRKEFLRQHQKRHLTSIKNTIRFLYSEESDMEEIEGSAQSRKDLSKEGIHVCEVCSMVFTKKKTLSAHENYHSVDVKQEID